MDWSGRQGGERQGRVMRGELWHGGVKVRQAWPGEARCGVERLGAVRQARLGQGGVASRVLARCGRQGELCRGQFMRGMVRQVRRGDAWPGAVRFCAAWLACGG